MMLRRYKDKDLTWNKHYLKNHPRVQTSLVLFLAAIIAYIPLLLSRSLDRYFFATSPHDGPNPCTLPEGAYTETCAQIDSKPMGANQALCNFTAICDTGKGKYLGAHAVNYYKYGQYGDKCPPGLLYYQELQLPKFTQFKAFENERGLITNRIATRIKEDYLYRNLLAPPEANFSFFAKVKITEVEDQDCIIRKQLSTASNTGQDLAIASIAGLATLKMLV